MLRVFAERTEYVSNCTLERNVSGLVTPKAYQRFLGFPVPRQRTVIGEMAWFIARKTDPSNCHHIRSFLRQLRYPLSKLNYNIPEMYEGEWRRNLIGRNQTRQGLVRDSSHHRLHQFRSVECTPSRRRPICLMEGFLHPFQKTNDRFSSVLLQTLA